MSHYVEDVRIDEAGFCYARLRGIGWVFCGKEGSQTARKAHELAHFMAMLSELQS